MSLPNPKRKRSRPSWTTATFLLASSFFFPNFNTVLATTPTNYFSVPSISSSTSTSGRSSEANSRTEPRGIAIPMQQHPSFPDKEVVPFSLDIILKYSGHNFQQLNREFDDIFGEYLQMKLSGIIATPQIGVHSTVVSTATEGRRIRDGRGLWQQQQQDVVLRSKGNVVYDRCGDSSMGCRQDEVTKELARFLTLKAVVEDMDATKINGINDVREIRQVVVLEERIEGDLQTRHLQNTTTDSETGEVPLDGRGNPLTRPSLQSIIFGFILTGLAAAGLVFYGCLYYRKRQKRLRKERLRRQSGQLRMPAPRPAPPGLALMPSVAAAAAKPTKTSPSIPTTSTVPVMDDDQSDISGFGLETKSTDGGPADAFARELQMAASKDQRVWAELQRKKTAWEHSRELQQMESTSPIPPPPPPSDTPPLSTSKQPPEPFASVADLRLTKSFPYGDESHSDGIELIVSEMPDRRRRDRPPRPSGGLQPEEKKDDYMPAREQPVPSRPLLPQGQPPEYNSGTNNGNETRPTDVVDEVEKLSRFVQRYEKRKERRTQLEAGLRNQASPSPDVISSRNTSYDESISSNEESFSRNRFQREDENLANLHNVRPSGRPQAPSSKRRLPRSSSTYRGITMTGEVYSKQSADGLAYPSMSGSSSDADSFDISGEEEVILRTGPRLGITPFSIPKPSGPSVYNTDPASSSGMASGRGYEMPSSGAQVRNPPSTQGHKPRLNALRSNEAIIDSSQSDINYGGISTDTSDVQPIERLTRYQNSLGEERIPYQTRGPRHSHPISSHSQPKVVGPDAGAGNGTAVSGNPKFNQIRNMFEDKGQKAVFPPGEYWQSGKGSK